MSGAGGGGGCPPEGPAVGTGTGPGGVRGTVARGWGGSGGGGGERGDGPQSRCGGVAAGATRGPLGGCPPPATSAGDGFSSPS